MRPFGGEVKLVALNRDITQAQDLNTEHRQDRGDQLGPGSLRAHARGGSVTRSPRALTATHVLEADRARAHERPKTSASRSQSEVSRSITNTLGDATVP